MEGEQLSAAATRRTDLAESDDGITRSAAPRGAHEFAWRPGTERRPPADSVSGAAMEPTVREPQGVVDIDACAQEPIAAPGAIQPHGCLLVVAPENLRVLQASANCAAFLGREVLPGTHSLADITGPDSALLRQLRAWLDAEPSSLLLSVDLGQRRLQLTAHRGAQGAILEFKAPPSSERDTLEALYPRLRAFVDQIEAIDDIGGLSAAAAKQIRSMTGFDRVLVYSFDADWNGTVVAEDSNGRLPSYLGLHFPAADVPAQARALYRLNRVRLIADAGYEPVPVLPALSPVDGAPLDMSFAALRSVSPVHLQYMRNMGTGCSMSVSIVVEGQLWGLLSCHSVEPRNVNAQLRSACDFAGKILSMQIASRQRSTAAVRSLRLQEVARELLARLATASDFQAGLGGNPEHWLSLAAAGGAAVLIEDQVITAGRVPDSARLRRLAEWLQHERHGENLITDTLSQHWSEGGAISDVASGVLAVPISQLHPSYLMWFRPERLRSITWGGEPGKTTTGDDARLHPRKSFDRWVQLVRLRSEPWQPEEVDSALQFRNSIVNFVLRRAEESAALSEQLERSNRELEAFSYSVSHDLRAPFRHIVGYSELLSDREQHLDERSRHYLRNITEAALAAGRLVDDLLNFSQLGRAALSMTRVDMNKILDEVRRTHQHEAEGRQIEWRVRPLPPAWGDAALLRQAMANLVSNALKYTRGRELTIITIDGEERGRETVYRVADNGVGFDMDYVGKLFGIFQRLHRAEDFEGTGISLALTKRVVDRHGGHVAAEGRIDGGATFSFSLPKYNADERTTDD
jgi:light-regulated signal transduction histidine kinase (bacteriophytochrome)